MTALKQEAFALIESIPDEKSDVLIKIIKNIREVLAVDSRRRDKLISRAEQNLAVMEEIESLIGKEDSSKNG